MRILVLTSTFSRWEDDIEPKFIDYLCHYLSEEHEIHVLAPHYRGSKRMENNGSIKVFRFRYAPESWETLTYDGGILSNLKRNRLKILLVPIFLLAQFMYTAKLVRAGDYDLIHAHWIIPQGLTSIIARFFSRKRLPIVLTSHGGDLYALKGSVLSRIKRWITRSVDKLTVVSSAMRAKAAEMGLNEESDIEVVPMGVDSRETFTPPRDNNSRRGLLFVGRLVDKKGIEYLLDAMPQILCKHPEERLIVIGDGPLRTSLERHGESLGLKDSIKFTGAITNELIPEYLRQSAICIFPSVVTDSGDQEGTPVAIMEALACGCATIVTDFPGATDIIKNGVTGLLVPERSPEAIAAKVGILLSHRELCEHIGENGRRIVEENYDWRIISNRFSDIFTQLAQRDTATAEIKNSA